MSLHTRQQDLPLSLNPQPCFEDITASRTPHPELGKLCAAELQARSLQPPAFQSLLWNHDKESFGKRFSRADMRSWCAAAAAATTTPHGALESSQKRLLIFDQSGDQTRLLRCPFPLRFPSPAAAEPMKFSELHCLEKTFKEEFDENHLIGKESEMHEDTDEINALLYSDDDYDNDDDDDDEDDEVMSTGHSPYPIEQVCNKRELDEIDGPSKRQKLLDNADKMSIKLNGLSENVPESKISTKEDTSSGLSNDQSRKDKIHTALKILESVVPGAKGEEALLLLDEAIDYLKLLKRDLISNHYLHHGGQEI